jgi:predicted AlkP superfamily pyrophosphatase or phosphodiesterase
VNTALALVDAAIGRLVDGLKARGLYERADLIVVADHGMEATSPQRIVYMDDLIDPKFVHVEAAGTLTGLRAEPGHEAAVEQALLKPHDHMECWRKGDVPPQFHYGANPRVPPILCLANLGWSISSHDYVATHSFSLGQHGFDNFEPHMGALFVAEGPAFRQGVIHKTFDNVDVYPLMADLLGIRPEKNDGRLREVSDMLRASFEQGAPERCRN